MRDPRQGIHKLEVPEFDVRGVLDHDTAPQDDWRDILLKEMSIEGHIHMVPPGWEFVLRCLFKELVDLGWDRHLTLATDKHGGLLVAPGLAATPAMEFACRRAQKWSFQTCSRCGDSAGTLRPRGRRMETTCSPCHDILMKQDAGGKHAP